LRDCQVLQEVLTPELSRHPEAAGLWIELGRKEGVLSRASAIAVRRFKMRKLNRLLNRVKRELIDPAARLATKTRLRTALVQGLSAVFAEVLSRRRSIDLTQAADLHSVRKAFKKFRYMAESFPPSLALPVPAQVSAMGEYQTALGKIHDVEVFQEFVLDHAARNPRIAFELGNLQEALLQRRHSLVQDYVTKTDSLAKFWPMPLPPPEVPRSVELMSS
jgi:CHAD domain-containing protein